MGKVGLIVILCFVLLTSVSASVSFLHEAPLPPLSSIPTIPIMITYLPSEWKGANQKTDTLIFKLNREEWAEWLCPTLKVVYRIDLSGGLEIYSCEVSSSYTDDEEVPVFNITDQKFMIEGNRIHATMTCYLGESDERMDEQLVEFLVHVIPVANGLDHQESMFQAISDEIDVYLLHQ